MSCPCCKRGIPSGERKSPYGLVRAYCTVCSALFWWIDGKWQLLGQPRPP